MHRIEPVIVRPRVFTADSREPLLLSDVVADHLQHGDRRPICVVGASGAGKTTALAHLAAVLPATASVTLLDEPTAEDVAAAVGLLIYTTIALPPRDAARCCGLAAWSDDDIVEYLLVRHGDRCGSVVARLGTRTDRDATAGKAELWSAALDRLAEDENITGIAAALRAEVRARVDTAQRYRVIAACCLRIDATVGTPRVLAAQRKAELAGAAALRLLRHGTVSTLLAAELLIGDLARDHTRRCPTTVPGPLLRFTASMLAADPTLRHRIERLATRGGAQQPFLASLMHAAFPDWTPGPVPLEQLSTARLEAVPWTAVTLAGAQLSHAWLRQAHLERANLDAARAAAANFHGAHLCAASMFRIVANGADFGQADLRDVDARGALLQDCNLRGARATGALLHGALLTRSILDGAVFADADLRNVDLTGASCTDVDCTGATLDGALLAGTDLRTVTLRGASLIEADLRRCQLEGVELPVAMTRSCLEHANLTGSIVSDGDLRHASLYGALLGAVDWPNVDLRGADLRRATFHMGSSRSGLLFSGIASDGSRTGFYSDDSLDDHFKTPEEVRKANLRGADLRGARIDDVDFYLVDLRGGRWDRDQEAWLRRSGAILHDRISDGQ